MGNVVDFQSALRTFSMTVARDLPLSCKNVPMCRTPYKSAKEHARGVGAFLSVPLFNHKRVPMSYAFVATKCT